MAVGWSMGGDQLANMIGNQGSQCFLFGAFLIHMAIKKQNMIENIKWQLGGLYNYLVGFELQKMLEENKDILRDEFRSKLGINIDSMKQLNGMDFETKVMAPLLGFKDNIEYHKQGTCYARIPKIKVPVLFLNALDDTVINKETIDYDIFHSNPNVVLATTERGGHIGYHTNILFTEHWVDELALKFLRGCSENGR